MAMKAELAELQAMIDRLGDNDPSPADKERAAFLMHEISRNNPLRKHLIEATQLVESVESTARPLLPADKSQLITSLAFAGEHKIGLFAAMRQITKVAQA